jgi:hypothetical protein
MGWYTIRPCNELSDMFKLSLGPHPNLPLEREFQNMHPGLQSISYLLLMECSCDWIMIINSYLLLVAESDE